MGEVGGVLGLGDWAFRLERHGDGRGREGRRDLNLVVKLADG